ncbi:hypothetical protein TWF481_006086 [Arthrobotrys musiformis]|uniref:CmcJ-like methyltransferase n=1 Tax=Arthrobotrys musiformis TaxID=47236 RepID=A0AAV9WFM8_9PEZI
MTSSMETEIHYLAKDELFDREKPFDTDFSVASIPGARSSNHTVDTRTVVVNEITNPDEWDLNTHGFCIIKAETKLDPDDVFTRKKEIQNDYWYEIEAILHEKFPEYSRIDAYDCTVRKRDPDFPRITRTYVDYEQPARRPHTDCSQKGSYMNLEHSFPGQEEFWKGKEFDILNVWRPLIGPCDDWPLALCDWTSVDQDNDIRLNDALRRDRVDENSLLHFNPSHRWYFIRNHSIDDLIVFRNADSHGKRARGFHVSVMNPTSESPARQSVEVRLVAFR